MEYLAHSNRVVDGIEKRDPALSARGKQVLVIGGGDTGADCVGTANRQGAKRVYQFEIMPKPPLWKKSWNPQWPHWPTILRTSSSHEEGCHRDRAVETTGFRGTNGSVEAVHFQRIEWKPASNGDGPSMVKIPGSDFSMKFDMILLSMGFDHVHHDRLLADLKIDYDLRGNVKSLSECRTSVEGIYGAGDAVTGASLVVRAIHQGRQAAAHINSHLKKH
ncbi:MAG: hypothetical protein E4H13_01380 [Calditrichales bacterium]|nr:MAG: hypothetical protein E4H13_01380 [Calditrichales bacterium]